MGQPGSGEDLGRYLDDIRMIKHALVEAEGSLRIFAWYYYVCAGMVVAATALNLVLARLIGIRMHEALVFVWIPVLVLCGVVEMLAWVRKSARDRVPLVTPSFAKYAVAFTGFLAGIVVLTFLLIRPDLPVPGIVLILVGLAFCLPAPYTHFWFALEAFALIVLGLLLVLLDARGTAYFIADGALVAVFFVVAGVVESLLTRRAHG